MEEGGWAGESNNPAGKRGEPVSPTLTGEEGAISPPALKLSRTSEDEAQGRMVTLLEDSPEEFAGQLAKEAGWERGYQAMRKALAAMQTRIAASD
jgi:hypothetical protein